MPAYRRKSGGGEAGPPARSKKTMLVRGVRTSVGLEPAFWACLAELAAERRVRLSALVDAVAAAKPRSRSLASALRVFALQEARRRPPPARPAGASALVPGEATRRH